MIRKLRLTNFKGIEQGEIEFSPLTILVGSNNSGKTTILESLFLAPNPARRVLYGDTALGIIQNLHQTLDSRGAATLLFNYRANYAKIECDINGEPYSLEFVRGGDDIFFTSNKQNTQNARLFFNQQRAFAVAYASSGGVANATYDKPFIEDTILINSALIKNGYNYMRQNWASIMNSGVCQKVIKEVSELSNETYINVTLEPFLQNTYAIYAFLEDGRRIRLGDLGEGIQTYIVTRILYEMAEPGVLLWDDIEAHLNPRMLIKLSGWFSDIIESGKQVVLTTHSIEALKLLAEANPKATSILLTSLKNNILKTKPLLIEEINSLFEAGIDVRIAEPFLL